MKNAIDINDEKSKSKQNEEQVPNNLINNNKLIIEKSLATPQNEVKEKEIN